MSMDIEGAGAGAGAGARAGAGAHSSENDILPLGATGLSNILTRMDMSPAKRHKKANDGEGMGENAVLPKTLDWNTAARAESGDDARSDVSACLPAPPRPAFSAASAAAPVPVPAARVAARRRTPRGRRTKVRQLGLQPQLQPHLLQLCSWGE